MALSSITTGWYRDIPNSRLAFYYQGTKVGHLDASGFTITDGTTTRMTDGLLAAAGLGANLKKGFISLDLFSVREAIANVLQAAATGAALGSGGILATDTTPILQRINGATDKAARISWVATDVGEIQFAPVPIPPDYDNTEVLTVHLLVYKNANTDTTFVIDVQAWSGIGDTEMGGDTAAITETVAAEKSVSLTGANVGAHPGVLTINLVPGAHANDAVYLLAAWIEYTRRT